MAAQWPPTSSNALKRIQKHVTLTCLEASHTDKKLQGDGKMFQEIAPIRMTNQPLESGNLAKL